MTTPSERRRAASAASASETAARNSANIAANTATNAGMTALLGALPGPLSGAAMALSEGVSAAIKSSSTQARSVPPGSPPGADPTKIFAAQLAFAIISAIWCFMKSILNPLPIIGIFFPLCSEQDRAQDLSALTTQAAASQVQTTDQPTIVTTQPSAISSDTASTGISFEQYLAATSPRQIPGRVVAQPRTSADRQLPATTPAPAPTVSSGVREAPGSVATAESDRNITDVRKLFGL